jgi:alanine racemase
MNLTMVDVTDIPGVQQQDEVVLIGEQGDETISVDLLASLIGTINYEVVARLPHHIPRTLVP